MSTTTSDGLLCLEDGREIGTSTLWKIRAVMGLIAAGNIYGIAAGGDMGEIVIGGASILLVLTLVYWSLLRLGSRKH